MSGFKKIPEISPTFCVYPWMEFNIGATPYVRLCCLSPINVEDKKGGIYPFGEQSLDNYWNSWGLRQVRKKMLNGEKLKYCHFCYLQEKFPGHSSYRQDNNRYWLKSKHGKDILERVKKSRTNGYRVEKQPLYLDIRPGNLCNLKCRMCTPGNSSKIYEEQKQFLKNKPSEANSLLDTSYFTKDYGEDYNWHKNKEIWKDIYKWAPGVKQLYFTGGEPTLIKENWNLIDYLQREGYSKDIDLMFNINCTQVPNKLLDTFSTFSKVNIMFSVDGYGEVQEYIRHPSKWKDIENNIIKILKERRENTYFRISPVVQVYNILDLTHLFRWIDNLQVNYGVINSNLIMYMGPKYLDISILPKNIKQKALSKIEEYEKSYEGNDNFFLENLGYVKNVLKNEEKNGIETELKRFYKYTNLLDQHRGESFKEIFPELNTLLDEDGRWKS